MTTTQQESETEEQTETAAEPSDKPVLVILEPSENNRAKVVKAIKFTEYDNRADGIRAREFTAPFGVTLMRSRKATTLEQMARRVEKRGMRFCSLDHLMLFRLQTAKATESDPLARIDWRSWIVAPADTLDDSLKADPEYKHTVDMPMILVPYTTMLGGALYLGLRNVVLPFPAGTQFLVRDK